MRQSAHIDQTELLLCLMYYSMMHGNNRIVQTLLIVIEKQYIYINIFGSIKSLLLKLIH